MYQICYFSRADLSHRLQSLWNALNLVRFGWRLILFFAHFDFLFVRCRKNWLQVWAAAISHQIACARMHNKVKKNYLRACQHVIKEIYIFGVLLSLFLISFLFFSVVVIQSITWCKNWSLVGRRKTNESMMENTFFFKQKSVLEDVQCMKMRYDVVWIRNRAIDFKN